MLRTIVLLLASVMVAPSFAEPVRLLLLDWSSQRVITRALGIILEEQGVSIEFVQVASDAQWFQLAQGKADVQVEVWQGSMGTKFDELVGKGFIQDAVTHIAKTREDWWYPLYVEQQCPGLPNWRALKSCAHVFAENGSTKGIYYSGPWEKPDAARIRALGLDFQVNVLKDSDAINAQINSYISEQRPLLIFNWTPNWVDAKYEGKFVEFPPYDPACESDPLWGENLKFTWDCANPSDGWLKTAISNTLNDKSQCAYDVILAFKLNNFHLSEAALLADQQRLTLEQAAKRWLQTYQQDVTLWSNHSSCNTLARNK